MKKILFWASTPMQGKHTADDMLAGNRIGSNSGNLLFLTSVARALMTGPDTVIDSIFTAASKFTDADIERINAEYDCFVMPLANAFRTNYEDKLRIMTGLIRKLRIPCAVVGVGMQAPSQAALEKGFPFDSVAREFVTEVLKRSAMLGVRGEHTSVYLKKLGFAEDRDFTVIGCPSMYLKGAALPETRVQPIGAQSKVAVNGKIGGSRAIHRWMDESCRELENFWYIPQTIEEFWMMGYGVPIPRLKRDPLPPWRRRPALPDYIPFDRKNPVLRKGRSVGFLNAYTWLDFMEGMEFSYGCNIHGNIAAALAGTPCMVIERDLRVGELAAYYELPRVSLEKLQSGKRVTELYQEADYGPMQRNHRARFDRFVGFLNANGLEHIYHGDVAFGDAPYDRYVCENGALPPFYPASDEEVRRLARVLPVYRKAADYYGTRIQDKAVRMLRRKK